MFEEADDGAIGGERRRNGAAVGLVRGPHPFNGTVHRFARLAERAERLVVRVQCGTDVPTGLRIQRHT